MIREVFTPSDTVLRGINDFLDEPLGGVDIHASAFRVVRASQLHSHEHNLQINRAQELLQPLTKSALYLSGVTKIVPRKDGGENLLFQPEHQGQLDKMTNVLNAISGSYDRQRSSHSVLYLELAQGALTTDVRKREMAKGKFLARTHHPGTAGRMYVNGPTLALRHIPLYPLSKDNNRAGNKH